ncbi:hypothetical protein GCM10010244_35470 [Streptomyces coeruleorubidus]|nr:hypothetical protein GCM10010244_35470 [Streptomyces bellus]
MAGMSGEDRRKVWVYALWVLGAIALAVIGIFTVTATIGGSSNNCTGAVCGDKNSGNNVGTAGPTK